MAQKYWQGGTASNTGNWSTAANWSDGSVPVDGDTVIIDGRSSYNITDGLNQSSIQPAELRIVRGSPSIGTTAAPLQIGPVLLNINVPTTDGSNPAGAATIHIATGTDATTVTIYGSRNTGSGGIEPVVWKGTHSTNVVRIYGGNVGIATGIPGDTASAASIQVLGDATVRIGSGVTVPSVIQTGGTITLECAATTINQDAGSLESRGTGAITTAYINGTFRSNSTGTITTLQVEPSGFVDFTGNTAARTVTTCNVHGGGKINAALPTISGSAHAITFTNGVDCIRGAKSGQVDGGGDITVTFSSV